MPGEDLIALPGKGEILFGDSSFIMRGEIQRHPESEWFPNVHPWKLLQL
jgi:hypothetical protein